MLHCMGFDRAPPKPGSRSVSPGGSAPTPGKQTLVEQQLGGGVAPQLRSPRFAGDPILEACFEDRARLAVGAQGASVGKVQQALLDLGFSIGAAGVDERYGPAVSEAVKQFKAREKLGFETMGDVGPGTMHRLDELFADAAPDEQAPEGAQLTALDFVVTTDDGTLDVLPEIPPESDDQVIAASLVARSNVELAAAPGRSGGEFAKPGDIAGAVRVFKDKVNVTNPFERSHNVASTGQFFWSRELGLAVKQEIDALRAIPGTARFCDAAARARDKISHAKDAKAELSEASQEAKTTRSVAKARMLKLVHGDVTGGAAIEHKLWTALAKRTDNSLPDLRPLVSLLTLRTVRNYDNASCGVHMLEVADRVKDKGGVTRHDAKTLGFAQTIATGSGFRDARPVDTANHYLGDVVDQSGVASAVAQIRRCLDGGLMVHARVLSGVGVGKPPAPDRNAKRSTQGIPLGGEHSVLIIGHDSNRFVFNDPDATRSNNPERGFGLLIFDGVRLTTALNEADLKVNTSGDHEHPQHRYQVLSLNTM